MKRTLSDFMVFGVATLLLATSVSAQPLAEVARKEKERRQALAEKPEKAKVYTNADLGRGGRLTTGTSMPAAPTETAGAAEQGGAGEPGSPTAESGEVRDEQYWRTRITQAREGLQRTELLASALQNRVDSLWTDYTARDDPAQRAIVEQDRQTAVSELQRTRAEIDRLKQELAGIEDEARRERVPPGWLR